MTTLKKLKWNTGRSYTEHGHRIACAEIDGGVYMVDVDRGIAYFFPNCPLNRDSVMARYDAEYSTETHLMRPTSLPWDEIIELRNQLELFAINDKRYSVTIAFESPDDAQEFYDRLRKAYWEKSPKNLNMAMSVMRRAAVQLDCDKENGFIGGTLNPTR